MKTKFAALLVTMTAMYLCLALPADGQTASADSKMLFGVWRGHGAAQEAGITLTLSDDGGSLAGAILLWHIDLGQGKPAVIEPAIPEPILSPRFDGQTLTFQVRYRGPLPSGISSTNPMLTYRLKLTAPGKGELAVGSLVTDAEAITGSPLPLGPPMQMIRTEN